MENEIWKDVKGFEGRFKISSHGRVVSINGRWNGEREMVCAIDSTGYKSAMLRNGKVKLCTRVHVLVAENFVSNKPEGANVCVNHKDGNKLNNHFLNLEWTNLGDNVRHAVSTGLLRMKGERHFNRKLDDEQVYRIKFLTEGIDNYTLAREFGVSREQVRDIRLNKNWKHITKDYFSNSNSFSVGA